MSNDSEIDYSREDYEALTRRAISQPLVTNIYTADPSAHVFEGKIYVYPSHDIEAGIPFNDLGDHFDMRDYHVLRLDSPAGPATDCGVALDIKDVKWAKRQMWAPDAATKDGKYYLFDLNMKPNLTGPGRPDRDNRDSLIAMAARAAGWSYTDLLLNMLAQSWTLGRK